MAPIDALGSFLPTLQQPQQLLQRQASEGPTFHQTLEQFLDSVNKQQHESGKLSERFIKGEAIDLHDVMIAAEKAKTSFQLLMELRNKALDLYREALRIQV